MNPPFVSALLSEIAPTLGIQTIQQLLVTTQQTLPLRGRPSSQIIPHDPRIDIKLADLGLLGLRLAGVDIICRDLCTDAGT
ncbi:hypothetical protein [Dickeya dianthicola]|uniref:hypothetical protein n=1 Tax=Dickeya dianthicola TaxID=204039 RepID=UPI00039E4F66|nr:hypothetical protein [Dickeya dianthicola]MCI4071165.1 hypothetical protein [Dickeya dianthicola]MCI4116780.1 hypothetical protein [Dickeya dianthicola]MCI4121417.1 hypothetical protein [Dickeya dianthicola]MCI4121934.1 hypothetical protein [Dickeya dianthicola]MCI4191803.1 hypothetical protein [Dickeya dianthicola]